MKKIKRSYLFLFSAIVALVAVLALLIRPTQAYAAGDYSFELEQYDVVYDINSDRTMDVEETITVHFLGWNSTGFYRDIPVNAGDRVRNVRVTNADGSEADYDVDIEDSNFITVDIGDTTNKYDKTVTYILTYEYHITQPTNKNAIYLNPIGYGWECDILNATVTLKLPDGFDAAKTKYYIGNTDVSSTAYTYDQATNTITATVSNLSPYNGVTFDLYFDDGVLSTYFDFMPYVVVIVGCLLLAALVAVKFLVFSKSRLTPVVNLTPPDGMDPLVMGKLIDNKVNNEDLTSLIFYWASKGFLKINLADEQNPELIRVLQNLPDDYPEHQKMMFNNMFGKNDAIKVSSLENRFYVTAEAVTKQVNSSYRSLYDSKSIGVSVIFAVLGALLMCVTPVLLAITTISPKLFLYLCFVMLIPSFIVYGLTESVMYLKLKTKKSTRILSIVGIIALCAVFTGLYAWLLPSSVMELAPKILCCVVGFAVIMLSVTLISRTQAYNEKLNHIIGYRNFILYTEKDKLEAMIEENPQLYYEVLPYAQVLGVTDVWEDKFKSITVAPPQWLANPVETYFEFAIINRAIRRTNVSFTSKMVSRPSSSGLSGGGRGGISFGGHGGGGHGGGGGRGR